MTGQDPVLEQIAAIRTDVAELKRRQVTYREATVTGVDPVGSTFTAQFDDGTQVAGIFARRRLPAVGDVVTLTLSGATPVFDPNPIGHGAVGEDELAAPVVETLNVALGAANGKNTVTFSEVDPDDETTPGLVAGDVWFRLDPEGFVTVGSWRWTGSTWAVHRFGDEVLAYLTASRIVTGTLAAGVEITVGAPAGDHILIGNGSVVAYAEDLLDGVPNEVARFGRTSGTSDPVTGRQTSNVTEDGVASFQRVESVEDPVIGGVPLAELLGGEGQRMIANSAVAVTGAAGIGASEYRVLETQFTSQPGHSYDFCFEGLVLEGDTAGDDVVLRVRDGGSGTPSISSPLRAGPFRDQVIFAGKWRDFTLDRRFLLSRDNSGVEQTHRLVVTVVRGNGTGTLTVVPTASSGVEPRLRVFDTGLDVFDTGVVNEGTGEAPTTTPVVPFDETFEAAWSATFDGAGNWDSSVGAECIQGYTPYYPPRGNARAMVGFPDLTGLLAGATVELVEISFYASHWNFYSGGTAVIGPHGSASRPATFNGTPGQIQSPNWGRQQRRTLTVTSWAAGLKAGTIRGFVLGPGPSTGGIYYGRFDGAGMPQPPRIRIKGKK